MSSVYIYASTLENILSHELVRKAFNLLDEVNLCWRNTQGKLKRWPFCFLLVTYYIRVQLWKKFEGRVRINGYCNRQFFFFWESVIEFTEVMIAGGDLVLLMASFIGKVELMLYSDKDDIFSWIKNSNFAGILFFLSLLLVFVYCRYCESVSFSWLAQCTKWSANCEMKSQGDGML